MDGAVTVAFVHTSTTLPAVFDRLADELIPGVERFHIVDESLLASTRKAGSPTPGTRLRLLGHVVAAADAGAELVVVTCSSIGAAVEACSGFVSVPVLRIDAPMIEAAVGHGSRIGVLATLSTTLEPTTALIGDHVREVTVATHLCEGAFDALQAGERDRHDELVRDGLRELAAEVDVVVLAQATMAHVADAVVDVPVPVLASPRLGMQRVAELVLAAVG